MPLSDDAPLVSDKLTVGIAFARQGKIVRKYIRVNLEGGIPDRAALAAAVREALEVHAEWATKTITMRGGDRRIEMVQEVDGMLDHPR